MKVFGFFYIVPSFLSQRLWLLHAYCDYDKEGEDYLPHGFLHEQTGQYGQYVSAAFHSTGLPFETHRYIDSCLSFVLLFLLM